MASLTQIAEGILAQAKRLDAFTEGRGLPSSSFDRHTLSDLPEELEDCRKDLVDGCQDLKQLGNGPIGQFYEVLFNVSHPNVLNVMPDVDNGPCLLRADFVVLYPGD